MPPNGQMPSSVSGEVGWFDRLAGGASRMVSRAWFFAGCVLLVVVWAPSYFLFGDVDTWQLVINTATTIVTFLLVALLQNTQQRADQATQHKLNALAAGVAELLTHAAVRAGDDDDVPEGAKLLRARRELCQAVGLEERESTD
jgi:low affinity Fe/Cu permease